MQLQVQQEVSLKGWNTFGIEATASQFLSIDSLPSLQLAIAEGWFSEASPALLLGGGSNIVLLQSRFARIGHLALKGRRVDHLDEQQAIIAAAAGESWHELVMWSLREGWTGLENLALIPGCVGAAPVQNIGAYGAELKDRLAYVDVVDRYTGRSHRLQPEQCEFAYRDSIFKRPAGRHWIIVEVGFRLHRHFTPNLGYGELHAELKAMGVERPSAVDVAQAVIGIRQRKLPDPAKLGNAGSFFKNPVVSGSVAAAILAQSPQLPHWPVLSPDAAYNPPPERPLVKLSAAWLIDQCAWKGVRRGDAAVHTDHALVLVNLGHASGKDLTRLAQAIQASVRRRFGVELEMEPTIW